MTSQGLNELKGMNMFLLSKKIRLTDKKFEEQLMKKRLHHRRKVYNNYQEDMKISGNDTKKKLGMQISCVLEWRV